MIVTIYRSFVEYFLVEFVIFNETSEIHYTIEMYNSYTKVRLTSHFYQFLPIFTNFYICTLR